MNPIWKSFKDEWPKCEWIWVSDYKKVVLWNHPFSLLDPTDCVWAEAKIEYPPVSVNKRHKCWSGPLRHFLCQENLEGMLVLFKNDIILMQISYCPFCGYKANK